MIKSIASLPKENGISCMMNNVLYPLHSNNWLVVLSDKVVSVEFGPDSTVFDNELMSITDVRVVEYLEINDLKYIFVVLQNDFTISDMEGDVQLSYGLMDSETATCCIVQYDNAHLFIGTTLGRILRISKDSNWEVKEAFNVSTNVWAICHFQGFLVVSLESGSLEFWSDSGSWTCIKVLESKYPGTCIRVLEDFLLVCRFHGNIDIINRNLCTVISIRAHTGYISGMAFSSNRVI